jgi:two-component system NtrC family sensor kinase
MMANWLSSLTLLEPVGDAERATTVQDGPTAARSPKGITLGTRLAVSVALTVTLVIMALAIAATRIAERQLSLDLRETARVTAVALADDIELRQDPWNADGLRPVLRDFINAAADLRWIAVFRGEGDNVTPVAGTSLVAAPPSALARQAISADDPIWSDATPHLAVIAAPIHRDDAVVGAVAVAVSLASAEQLQRTTAVIAITAAVAAAAIITFLVHLLARQLVLEPLTGVRQTIGRARGGDLAARSHVVAPEEMREVAEGLNAMLAELDDLHHSLRERVDDATAELRRQHEQLSRSYESVSQLRETAARSQQLAAVGQTVANVAHQIGTPLNLISGHVQLLLHQINEPAMRRRLEIVREQVDRMTSIVRDLLERSRPNADRRAVAVGDVLRTIGDAMRVRLGAAGVTLRLEIAEALPAVDANQAQLELALLNVVTNALDAMKQGGTLTIAATPTSDGVRIFVRDTGAGIPSDVLARVFEPWVTTKPGGQGTGLGLSITRDVVVAAGGAIAVAGTGPGGTTMTIDLPGIPISAQVQ